ncbi:MAG: hypothetical protein M3Q06_14315, partial [Bacteroidota bacterium]|nr:hypothetical protein [Bacteroidota bacterium]
MKNIKLLLGLLSVVVVMASCATMGAADGDSMDDSRTRQVGDRLYVEDPFYGTVVLERDPYTGRYYDVTYGSRYGRGYYGINPYGRSYRSYPGYYGRGNVIQQQQQPPQQQRPSREEL